MQETINNLAAAFVGESQARNRYAFYAKAAKKEGYHQVAALFMDTAEQERAHASTLFKMINALTQRAGSANKAVQLSSAEVPTAMGTTVENLRAAIGGETYEFSEMYPAFAGAASAEDLPDVASRLRAIAAAEELHAEQYQKFLDAIEGGTLFKRAGAITWTCRNCGYPHEGTAPPDTCPACLHPAGYFQRKEELV